MTARHEHLDEGTIHAWLDGALPPDESARIEALVGTCGECAALVAEARGLVAASSRILSSLDAVPSGVIPGTDSGADQLAALRARRRETSRRWWNDRRVLAAASLVFVAGASSLVWRYAGNEATSPAAQMVDAVRSETDSAAPVAAAPPPAPAPVSARENASPGARVGGSAALRDAAPLRVAEKRAMDSSADQKVAAATSLARGAATNEARRADVDSAAVRNQAIDSTRATQRLAERSAFEIQLQQGSTQANRQRAEQLRPTAPPPSATGAGARLGAVASAAPAADFAGFRRCYRLLIVPAQPRETIMVVDSVQLLNETLRELPTWQRARAAGWASDSALAWRPVDSTTVELRSRIPTNPLVVRFSTIPGGQPLPDLGREQGVRAALPSRLICPG